MALARAGSRSLQGACAQGVTMARSALSAVALALGWLHPLLLCLACVSAVPKGVSAVVSARSRYRSAVRWIENTRNLDLLAYYMMDRESAEEIRVHQVGDYLVDSYSRLSDRALREQRRPAWRAAMASVAGGSLSGLLTGLTYLALGFLVWSGRTPVAGAGTALLEIEQGRPKGPQAVDVLPLPVRARSGPPGATGAEGARRRVRCPGSLRRHLGTTFRHGPSGTAHASAAGPWRPAAPLKVCSTGALSTVCTPRSVETRVLR
ncbi:hypothetical protein AB0D10_39335 [Kitasatospora sp. NPDC048545]|uniref:hypothetical protein n=1 Tax=Kitasatospora sp. NPDC048545 TaxID=3157208 RepID=UPI0033F63203